MTEKNCGCVYSTEYPDDIEKLCDLHQQEHDRDMHTEWLVEQRIVKK